MVPARPQLLFALTLSFLVPRVCSQQAVSRVVDDSYAFDLNTRLDGIQYSPQWYTENYDSNRQQGTLHTSIRSGSNLVYFFQGSAIYYYADRDVPHGSARVSLDNDEQGVIVNSNASSLQYQQLLWKATNLGPGDHQLVISHAGADGEYIGLDYLLVESNHGFAPESAGPAASVVPAEAVFVDDADSQLIYSSGWDPVLPSEQWATYFNNTMHRTNTPGASVTLRFNGTAAWYFTDLQPVHGKVNITVDGEKSWIVYGNTGQQMQQRMLWNSTNLPYGEHNVTVTHQDAAGTYATLDFFRYLPGTPPTSNPSKSSTPIGAIVGAVIGGLILLLLAGFVWFWLRRRHNAKNSDSRSYIDRDSPTLPPLLNPPQTTDYGYVAQPFSVHPATSSGISSGLGESLSQVPTHTGTGKGQSVTVSNTLPSLLTETSSSPPMSRLSSDWTQTGSERGADDRQLDAPPAYN
ncbi:hypothetical protein FRC12_005583 [Ceratobasidium sp. 428]|nr:hypothetical protein FRC12_005583 [Ceratobasidium sp. 428]